MDGLDRLSIQELFDLNAAIQSELSKRLLALQEENVKLKQNSVGIREKREISISTESSSKSNKNPGWINTGKLLATANRLFFKSVNNEPKYLKHVAHRDFIWDVKWNPNESSDYMFASCSADGSAKLWRMDESSKSSVFIPMWAYIGHTGSVNSVRFHPSQNLLCTASGDTTVHIWKPGDIVSRNENGTNIDDEEKGSRSRHRLSVDAPTIVTPLSRLCSHQGVVLVGEWNADGTQLFSGSQDTTIKVWDIGDCSKPVYTLTGHDSGVTGIASHPNNNNLFASCSQDSTIRLWDTRTSSFILNVLHGHEKGVSHVLFDRYDPYILISGSDDCTVKIWDLKTYQCIRTIHTSYVVNHFCQSPNDDMLCLPSRNASAEIYSKTGVPLTILSGDKYAHNRMIYTCDWNHRGILTAGLDRNLILWDCVQEDKS